MLRFSILPLLIASAFHADPDDPADKGKKKLELTEDELEQRIAAASKKAAEEAAAAAVASERAKADKAAADAKAASDAEAARLQAEKDAAEKRAKELEDLKKGGEVADAALQKKIDDQALEVKALEAAIKRQREEGEAQRAKDLLDAHRREVTRGMRLPELVTGNTVEEINASVAKVKEREKALFGEAKEAARAELVSELPRPLQPPSNPGVPTHADRKRIAKIRDDGQYQAERAKLLQSAKDSLRRAS